METRDFDIVVIGAGMAGSTAAAHLAAEHRVGLIEAEEAAGYHTTGRSASLWTENYGPADVRALTRLSRGFYEQPPEGFADHALIRKRGAVTLAPADQVARLDGMLAIGTGLRPISIADVRARIPALRPEYAVAATIEEDAFDLDVAAIHQGFLKQLRARGGVLALRQRSGRITREGGVWSVETTEGTQFRAATVVDAAGAWGDEVGMQAGLAPLGLVPKRRTAAVIEPAPYLPEDWPMVGDANHSWYCRPEARTRLLVSPADETPMHPHDVQPDELDVALGIHGMQQALSIEVRRVERSWAGLRSFTPDGSLAIGWDARAPGFFWCIGQGGYGIQTAPAAGRLVADLIAGREPELAENFRTMLDPKRYHGAAAPALGAEASDAGLRDRARHLKNN